MLYPGFGKQVVAYTHIRTDEIVCPEQVGQPCRIHDDVAVVGHEECTVLDVFLYLLAVAQIIQFETLGPLPCPYLQDREHNQKIRYPKDPSYAVCPYVSKFVFHLSPFTFHLSLFTFHLSPFTFQLNFQGLPCWLPYTPPSALLCLTAYRRNSARRPLICYPARVHRWIAG